MSRYIDADTAKTIYLSKSAGEQLNRVPTADVQEVRHGKWKQTSSPIYGQCPYCEKIFNNKYAFCPNCGAKMDGKD